MTDRYRGASLPTTEPLAELIDGHDHQMNRVVRQVKRMAPGIIPVTSIPGWPTPLAGIMQQLPVAAFLSPNGLNVADVPTAEDYLSTYSGSAAQLSWNQQQLQAQLDALLDDKSDLVAFICAGTNSSLTATNVGGFLASITNNYRSLRAQISAATSLAQLQAININQGWPSNP